MPLAPREIDAIFSACDVTATLPCMSDLPIQTHQASPRAHTVRHLNHPIHPHTTPTRWTATALSTGPSSRRRSGMLCRSRRSGKGTSGKGGDAIQLQPREARVNGDDAQDQEGGGARGWVRERARGGGGGGGGEGGI
jgi:hypothetical protein